MLKLAKKVKIEEDENAAATWKQARLSRAKAAREAAACERQIAARCSITGALLLAATDADLDSLSLIPKTTSADQLAASTAQPTAPRAALTVGSTQLDFMSLHATKDLFAAHACDGQGLFICAVTHILRMRHALRFGASHLTFQRHDLCLTGRLFLLATHFRWGDAGVVLSAERTSLTWGDNDGCKISASLAGLIGSDDFTGFDKVRLIFFVVCVHLGLCLYISFLMISDVALRQYCNLAQ